MKIAVIGAGPAGITAAYKLSQQGYKVDLYEASYEVGGMSKSFELWGQLVDVGPHRFFSSDKVVNELWLEVVKEDYAMVDRLTRIYYKNKFFMYPLKPLNALLNLGIFESIRCVFSFGINKISPTKLDGSFQNWVISRFGKRLFEIFFKTYSEKLWGITCKELDADFAAQRIKKLSLWEALKNAFKVAGKNKHKTLVDQFAYPILGTGMVYNRMKDFIEEKGNKVFLNSPIKEVLVDNNKVIGLINNDSEELAYDHVISTMPMTLLVNNIKGTPQQVIANASKLTFRNTIIVYLEVEKADLFPDNWLYIHSDDLATGRITNFRNWVPQINKDKKSTILALEYWCNDNEPKWTESDEVLITQAKKELIKTKLHQGAAIINGHVLRVPKCYPVYNKGYKDHLMVVQNYLSTIENLTPIGRYGAFKYNNQDHSMLMGLMAAENIFANKKHNLWEINTDYDNYQESYIITKTGLTKQ